MSEEELLAGDDVIHGGLEYVFEPCETQESLLTDHYIKDPKRELASLECVESRWDRTSNALPHAEKSSSSRRSNEL